MAKAASEPCLGSGEMRDESIRDQAWKKEKENSFCSHSVEGAAVPVLRGSQAPALLAGTSCLLQSLIPAFPTDKAVEQIAVTSSELNGGGEPCGEQVGKEKSHQKKNLCNQK